MWLYGCMWNTACKVLLEMIRRALEGNCRVMAIICENYKTQRIRQLEVSRSEGSEVGLGLRERLVKEYKIPDVWE